MSQFTFKLEQAAKKSGGDKYVCEKMPEFNIYVPQSISRINNKPHKILMINVTNKEDLVDDEADDDEDVSEADDDDDDEDYDENDD